MTATTPRPRPPGRIWYAVAVLVAIAGWVGMAVVLYVGLSGFADRMLRLVVPGQAEFRLHEPGTYTIFHEYRSMLDGRVYDVQVLSGLQIRVRSGGTALELTRATGSSYRVGGYAGRSLFDFEVRKPGLYQIGAAYGDGRKSPQTVLAVDRGFVGTLAATIFHGLAMGLGGMAAGVAILIVAVRRRRRALQAPP